jgi:hypothetical protein
MKCSVQAAPAKGFKASARIEQVEPFAHEFQYLRFVEQVHIFRQ